MTAIREATESDIDALARITREGLKATYDRLIDEAWLAEHTEDHFRGKWAEWLDDEDLQGLLAETDGVPAGLVTFGKLKTPPPGMSPIRPLYAAEIYGIYVLPGYWRQGVGTALMKEAVVKLRDSKRKSLCLWVYEKNDRAVSFYKKMGGEACGKKEIEIGNNRGREKCFGWRDTASVTD